jgi:hypothetical protein
VKVNMQFIIYFVARYSSSPYCAHTCKHLKQHSNIASLVRRLFHALCHNDHAAAAIHNPQHWELSQCKNIIAIRYAELKTIRPYLLNPIVVDLPYA